MREKQPSCPNCDTVLTAQYHPEDLEAMWYECTLCGYRLPAKDFRSTDADDTHHRPQRPRASVGSR